MANKVTVEKRTFNNKTIFFHIDVENRFKANLSPAQAGVLMIGLNLWYDLANPTTGVGKGLPPDKMVSVDITIDPFCEVFLTVEEKLRLVTELRKFFP